MGHAVHDGNGTAKTLTLSFKLSSKVNKSDCYFHKSTQGSEGDGERSKVCSVIGVGET
jgi:hypothetical protein